MLYNNINAILYAIKKAHKPRMSTVPSNNLIKECQDHYMYILFIMICYVVIVISIIASVSILMIKIPHFFILDFVCRWFIMLLILIAAFLRLKYHMHCTRVYLNCWILSLHSIGCAFVLTSNFAAIATQHDIDIDEILSPLARYISVHFSLTIIWHTSCNSALYTVSHIFIAVTQCVSQIMHIFSLKTTIPITEWIMLFNYIVVQSLMLINTTTLHVKHTCQRDKLNIQKSTLEKQHDKSAMQRDELAKQRDKLAMQRNELAKQRDKLAMQRDELAKQRDRFQLMLHVLQRFMLTYCDAVVLLHLIDDVFVCKEVLSIDPGIKSLLMQQDFVACLHVDDRVPVRNMLFMAPIDGVSGRMHATICTPLVNILSTITAMTIPDSHSHCLVIGINLEGNTLPSTTSLVIQKNIANVAKMNNSDDQQALSFIKPLIRKKCTSGLTPMPLPSDDSESDMFILSRTTDENDHAFIRTISCIYVANLVYILRGNIMNRVTYTRELASLYINILITTLTSKQTLKINKCKSTSMSPLSNGKPPRIPISQITNSSVLSVKTNYSRSQSPSNIIPSIAAVTPMQGYWELQHQSQSSMVPASWLRRFRIIQRFCVLDNGEEVNLYLGKDGEILLEGGRLSVRNGVLQRTGKSNITLYFHRICEDKFSDSQEY